MNDDEHFSMEDQEVDIEAIAAATPVEADTRTIRFNDMVASGMAEEDAYAVLAEEHLFSDDVIAPHWKGAEVGRHMDIYDIRMLRMSARFATRR